LSEFISRTRVLVVIALIITGSGLVQNAPALSSDPISTALSWLTSHAQSNGSYGAFSEPQTAPAAFALWIRSGNSTLVIQEYTFLKNQLQNSTTWFWGGGGNIAEADIPGEILYSFAASHHLSMLTRLAGVVANLTAFQQSNGGFLGYVDPSSNKRVTSSVDTAMALRGLIGANRISTTTEQSAISYLLSLQNIDGSFNLTNTVKSDSLYSLGPDPISITALAVLTLNDASFAASDPSVTSALSYLARAESASFNGHVYAASLSAIAFTAFSEPAAATQAADYIASQQNTDGGFRDISRSTTVSEALDTGWAATALQLSGFSCCISGNSGGGGRRAMYL